MTGLFDHIPDTKPSSGNSGGIFSHLPDAAPLANTQKTFQRDEDETLYQQTLARIKSERARPGYLGYHIGEDGPVKDASPEETARSYVQNTQNQKAEQQAFEQSRTPFTRLLDTAAFIPSALVRAATRGEYGLGDVYDKLGLPAEYGQETRAAEGRFARANEKGLELLKLAGEASVAIPPLATMGAPAGGLAATIRAGVNTPPPAAIAMQRAANTGLRNDRLTDLNAFRESGVTPFGPAFTESGTAGVVKQLSEAPIVGAPVRNKLLQTVAETRDAGERIAGEYGAARTYRDVGNVVEGGINRFKDERVEPIQRRGSANPTSDAELAQIASAPARATSFKTKGDALYEKAWRGIPEEMARGRSIEGDTRFLGGMNNTRTLLQDIAERNQRMYSATRGGEPVDARLSYPVRGGVPGQIVEDIIQGRWRGNLQSMRDVRSNFRRLASGISDTERNTLTLSDMRRIQSSMTEDLIGLLDRNVAHYERIGDTATAAQVRRSIHDFRRADQFTRASAGRLETIEKLYGAQSAEQLGQSILKDAMGGRKGGNLDRLTALRRSLRNDEWDDVAAGVIRELGRPMGSARGIAEDAGFSVQSFTTNWNNMSPEAKGILFKNPHTAELGRALDSFARVANRMANFEALANTSRSATNALGITGLTSLIVSGARALAGDFSSAAYAGSVAAGLYGFGRFMTSPAYVRWLTRATELSATPNGTAQLRGHVRALIELAAREKDFEMQQLAGSISEALRREEEGRARDRARVAVPVQGR